MNDPSKLPHDERLAADPQYRERWESSLVDRFNPGRTSDDHDIHDALWLRAGMTCAGDRKTADLMLAASRQIRRLEAENATLRAKLGVAVAAMTKDRPLPEGGAQ